MKIVLAAALLAVASCSPQNVFTFTQFNPAGEVPFDQYWESFKQTHSKYMYWMDIDERIYIEKVQIVLVELNVDELLTMFSFQTRTMQIQKRSK